MNVALPSIQHELGFSATGLAWVVNAYLIAFGGLLLLAGRLGDLTGRRNVFLAGLAVFTLPRWCAELAQTQEDAVGARFVQGIGGAMTSAVILGVIVTMFPEPAGAWPRRSASTAFVASAGGAVGLLAGGILTQALNWHWIFFVNLPIGIVTDCARAPGRPAGCGARAAPRAPTAGCRADHRRDDARRVHHRQDGARRLGPAGHDRLRRGRGGAAGRVYRPRGARPEPADAAADLPLAQRVGRERGPDVDGRRACSRCSSWARCTCSRVLGYGPLRIGLAFLPVATVWARCRSGLTAAAVRFGARERPVAGLALMAGALSCSPWRRFTAGTSGRLPGHAADGRRGRAGLPGR